MQKEATRKFIYPFIVLASFFFTSFTYADLSLITWKGLYYGAIPNRPGISPAYCKAHTPGSFIHVVKKPYARPLHTNRGFTLDRSTFHIEKNPWRLFNPWRFLGQWKNQSTTMA